MKLRRLRLLDLFCGAGGCSAGYERAGFDVVGVDLNPACEAYYHRVCGGAFVCADALDYLGAHGREFDAIHASPPCQAHSPLRHVTRRTYHDMIATTREALLIAGKPYVIENVPGAPLETSVMLCGTMFGLTTPGGTAELRRHRIFETNWYVGLAPQCQHGAAVVGVYGDGPKCERGRHCVRRRTLSVAGHAAEVVVDRQRERRRRAVSIAGHTAQTNVIRNVERRTFTADEARHAMGGLDLPMRFLSQAIPPQYTEWVGRHLRAELAVP